jgi:hypothetical protein
LALAAIKIGEWQAEAPWELQWQLGETLHRKRP